MFVYSFDINCKVLYKSTFKFLIMLKCSAFSSGELKVQEVLLNNVMCRCFTRVRLLHDNTPSMKSYLEIRQDCSFAKLTNLSRFSSKRLFLFPKSRSSLPVAINAWFSSSVVYMYWSRVFVFVC